MGLCKRLKYDRDTRYQSREMIEQQNDRFIAADALHKISGIAGLDSEETPDSEKINLIIFVLARMNKIKIGEVKDRPISSVSEQESN